MNIPESHLAQEAVAALVDGELGGGPAARAARHLTGCAQCRMAVQAQREAKEALHASCDVTVPGDLLSRLRAIPFTADVPGPGGSLTAGPGQLTISGSGGAWSVPLEPTSAGGDRPGHARWLRRGFLGALGVLGAGVTTLALNLPSDGPDGPGPAPVARGGVEERTEIVPPVVRTTTVGTGGAQPSVTPGGTP
ncbi:zf-HC2 domain-containing protein [Geodermatophilus sp. DSM 44513]|uniref:anti-sigma factor family protein n=1 Tax=Geodermatophilus sp. DSM 44513 TaxID=1528104 RepID=UPI00126E7B61|nr:zf-HC2 domain-containing protein [Geodermatophilus sp. DSM 44513]WNV76606.1 zf-HC2 domain-containing protein [Geodermatophilus sp. DSM 44513]